MTRRSKTRLDSARVHARVGVLLTIVVAAVFYISYSSVNGVPWRTGGEVYVELPNAQRLAKADEVRVKGVRVGRVASVEAIPAKPGAAAHTRAKLSLDQSDARLPVDTTVRVRPASVLGASYVDLAPGLSARDLEDGGTLPLENAATSVDLTDLFAIFDRPTARSIQTTAAHLGVGLAGRGRDLNSSIGALAASLPPITRVARDLADPHARLPGFIKGYAAFTDALNPVSAQLADLISGGAATLGAVDRERPSLGAAIDALPPAERATTVALTRLQPALSLLADIADELRPAARYLPRAAVRLNATLRAGPPPLRQMPSFAGKLDRALATLRGVSRKSSTGGTIRKLTEAVGAVTRVSEILTPAQLHCNTTAGFMQAFGAVWTLGIGEGPAIVPFLFTHFGAEGEIFQRSAPSPNAGINYYPYENANECESGNELHDGVRQMLNNPPGFQGKLHPDTQPPPGVRERAKAAGLLDPPEGAR